MFTHTSFSVAFGAPALGRDWLPVAFGASSGSLLATTGGLARRGAPRDFLPFSEQRIEYILTTGGNWAGPIGDFRLVVDKGDTNNLVSICGDGVKKIGPTQFEMRKSDFAPERNLYVLILKRNSASR